MARSSTIDSDLVRELAGLLTETGLTEIEVQKNDLRIKVVRAAAPGPTAVVTPLPTVMPAAVAPPSVATAESGAKHPDALTSPMVGTAYRRPAPGAPAFVEVGSTVRAGERLLLIEAMKTFNDIVAPRAGTVRSIFVEDGQPVEYGEPLLVID